MNTTAPIPGRMSRKDRREAEQLGKRIEREIRRSNAPIGGECQWCRGSCCDRCQWTGLELQAEAS